MKSAKKGRKQGRARHLDDPFAQVYGLEDWRGVYDDGDSRPHKIFCNL